MRMLISDSNTHSIVRRATRWGAIAAIIGAAAFLFAAPAVAQNFTLDLGPTEAGGPDSTTGRVIQLLLLMTVLSVAPLLCRLVMNVLRSP